MEKGREEKEDFILVYALYWCDTWYRTCMIDHHRYHIIPRKVYHTVLHEIIQ